VRVETMGRGNDWCILRTSGPRTLTLADSLTAAGLEAWTPRKTTRRRLPRSRVHREIVAPILATFVFARAAHRDELRGIIARRIQHHADQHPQFSIFEHAGRIPLIADAQVAGLRAEEDRATAAYKIVTDREAASAEHNARRQRVAELRASSPTYEIGARVTVPQVAFAGMTGVVEQGRGKKPAVNFGGGIVIEIEAWLLEPAAV
jgi:hypothetical protein